ncbi:hypothetical protein J0X12_14920 [Sneathiella sp. CAU 1612]|uniref:Glycosyl transferase family 28 C-terminal domain-containing protein n=1 Tax=Sneathiella sedimenti TaxID=2816034 RepID=A0ABS3F9Z0_9PROT|nr:hypothetical protein [Sneathiella sedimenti]MBO0334916.1 hypothetical protein [Sneathiella sedimenti]
MNVEMYDILKIGDFRFPGGTSTAIEAEIRALSDAGYKVGLLQKDARTLKQQRPVHPAITEQIDKKNAFLVDPATTSRVEAKLVLIHNPFVFEDLPQGPFPKVVADTKIMVAHQPIRDSNGVLYFDVEKVHENAESVVGEGLIWAPISAVSRENMIAEDFRFPIADCDWTNLIFVEDWKVERSGVLGTKPIIGRHSRPDWAKWPATREDMLKIYPDAEDIDIRLLGVGDGLQDLMQGTYPENWETFEFGEIPPRQFLEGIDFFVYFHHPDWVEGFGRTIAEAAAAGAVVILPEYLRQTFGEAALYRRPEDVIDTVKELHQDPYRFMLQSGLGQHMINNLYGPEKYLERIGKYLGHAEFTSDDIDSGSDPVVLEDVSVDVTHIGDFRSCREEIWRIVNDVKIQWENGYKSALIHHPTKTRGDLRIVNPDVQALVEKSMALPVNPETPNVRTKLLTIHQPLSLFEGAGDESYIVGPRVIADKTAVILDRMASSRAIRKRDALLKTIYGRNIIWYGTTAEIRAALQAVPSITVDAQLWTVSISFRDWKDPSTNGRLLPIVGRVSLGEEGQWPTSENLDGSLPVSGEVSSRLLGMTNIKNGPRTCFLDARETFKAQDIMATRFIENLDFMSYYPGYGDFEIPVHAIAYAMCQGVPAILDGRLQNIFGRGPKYMPPARVEGYVTELFAEKEEYARVASEQARIARKNFGPAIHLARLNKLVGTSGQTRVRDRQSNKRTRVLFVSSNGVGVGHLTRLLAIARRMGPTVEPVFLTMSQALPVVEQAGYPVEFLPFHVYANNNPNNWNVWFREHLEQVLDFHQPSAVVFDGSNPYSGLIEAILPRDIKLVWIRRGMWKEEQNNSLSISRQKFFDLVIEPTDIAESRDKGVTAYNRAVTVKVPPIRLLDKEEILSKGQACEELGIDPNRPAVLIQLGSGSNRDIVSMIDTVLDKLKANPSIQPVIAEWMIAPKSLDFWPGIKRLRGFPLSRYFNAFDFTVSAAGYNSFNEIISFSLPAIFMANEHATMDDQGGRAAFVQEEEAAYHIPGLNLDIVERSIENILDPEIQNTMRYNCERLALENGATAAAESIVNFL